MHTRGDVNLAISRLIPNEVRQLQTRLWVSPALTSAQRDALKMSSLGTSRLIHSFTFTPVTQLCVDTDRFLRADESWCLIKSTKPRPLLWLSASHTWEQVTARQTWSSDRCRPLLSRCFHYMLVNFSQKSRVAFPTWTDCSHTDSYIKRQSSVKAGLEEMLWYSCSGRMLFSVWPVKEIKQVRRFVIYSSIFSALFLKCWLLISFLHLQHVIEKVLCSQTVQLWKKIPKLFKSIPTNEFNDKCFLCWHQWLWFRDIVLLTPTCTSILF